MPDAKIIQMFKQPEPAPPADESFDVDETLDRDFADSLLAVAGDIGDLWDAETRSQLNDGLRRIKAQVARWPDEPV